MTQRSEDPKLIIRVINFELGRTYMPTVHQRQNLRELSVNDSHYWSERHHTEEKKRLRMRVYNHALCHAY